MSLHFLIVPDRPFCYLFYYTGNNIYQSRLSRESGNPGLCWIPGQARNDSL
jgi:hypothetical protein